MPSALVRRLVRKALSLQKLALRRFRSVWLKLRWNSRSRVPGASPAIKSEPEDVFSRLDIVVINLDSRPDRLAEITEEMERMNIPHWRRLSAVDGRKEFPKLNTFFAGSIGCSLSHVVALEEAKWSAVDAVLICEDDVEFLVGKEEISGAIREFLENPHLDVLALYGRARGGSHHISPNLRIVVGLVGTVCYVVKPHMATVIGQLFSEGVKDLQKNQRKGKSDILWNKLQKRKYFFAAPIDTFTRNREGYSDIEGKSLGPR